MSKKGYIFLCSDLTEKECLSRQLFGGQEKYVSRVRGLEAGDRLYLYNYNSKKLQGIFEAESEIIRNIEPEAWNGDFPWQVRVKTIEVCMPLSREDISVDPYLATVIKFDRAGRPSARLSAETVVGLENAFRSSGRLTVYDNGTRYLTNDGHRVRSEPEQLIDNWLYEHRIAHGYEAGLPNAKRCDFEIPTDNGSIYIEYWGLNDKKYLKDKAAKLEIYRNNNLQLIELSPKHIKNGDFDKILADNLLSHIEPVWKS